MNKVFRVIWSVSAQAWVAVSELTKAHAKKSQSNNGVSVSVRTFMLSAAASTVLGVTLAIIPSTVSAVVAIGSTSNNAIDSSNTVTTGDNSESVIQAYNYYNPGSLSYDNANSTNANALIYSDVSVTGVAIGNHTDIVTVGSTGGKSGIAVGDYAKSTGGLSIALGALSQASGIGAVTVGTSSRASGFNSLAMMRQSAATADYATAIGSVAWANGTGSFAMGVSATAQGNQSIAIGSTAQETIDNGPKAPSTKYNGYTNTQTNGDRSMALGSGAKTSGADSFAVGSNARTGTFKTEYNQTLSNNTMVADTAALKAFAFGNNASAQKDSAIAFGSDSVSTGKDAIAFGINSNASGQGSVAFGTNASATHDRVVAIGTNATATHDSSMAIGENAKAYANNSLALGARAEVRTGNENSVALGNDAVVDEIGGQSNMTINGVRYEFAGKDAKGTISIAGGDVTERTITHVAAGRVSSNSTDAINGSQLYAVTTELNRGWSINTASDGGNVSGNQSTQVKLGDTVTIKAGKNINVTQNSQNITVATADNVTFNEVSTQNLTAVHNISSGNLTVSENTNVNNFTVKNGGKIDMGGNVVANISAPVNSGDAANKQYVDNSRTVVTSSDGSVTIKSSDVNNNGKSYDLSVNANLSYTADNNTRGSIPLNNSIAFNGTADEIVTTAANGSVTFKLADAVKNSLEKANTSMQSFTVGADKNAAAEGIAVNQSSNRFDVVGADNGNITTKVNNRTVEVDLTAQTKQDIANGTKANETINSKGLTFRTDATSSDAIKLGETLNVNGDDNIKAAAAGKDLNITLSKDLNVSTITAGKTKVSDNGISITNSTDASKTVSLTENGLNNGGNKIVNIAEGELNTTSTDAVNGSQLYATNQNVANNSQNISNNAENITNNSQNITNLTNVVNGGFGLADDSNKTVKAKLGETIQVKGTDGIKTLVNGTALEVGLSNNVSVGNDTTAGTITIKGQDGKDGISLNGKDGSIGLNGKDGANGTITVQKGEPGVNGKNGENLTRIVYTDVNGTHTVATMEDGLKFQGDKGDVIAKKLGETLKIKGNLAEDADVTDKNLRVDNVNGELIVKMAKSLTDLTNATFGESNDKTVISKDGVIISNTGSNGESKTVSLTDKGLDNGGNRITNVANGTDDSDAVNYAQLKDVQTTANAGWNLTTNGDAANKSKVAPGGSVDFANSDGNINITHNGTDVKLALNQSLNVSQIKTGDTTVSDNGLVINNGPSITKTGINAGDKVIGNVSNGTLNATSTEAVNGSQLYATNQNVTNNSQNITNLQNTVNGGFILSDDNKTEVKQELGKAVQIKGKDGVTVTADASDKSLQVALAGNVSVAGKDGKDGQIGVQGKDGQDGVTVYGNGSIAINGKDGADGKPGTNATLTTVKGEPGINGKDGENLTRIVYTDANGTHTVATMEDGLKFQGDKGDVIAKKLGETLKIKGNLSESAVVTDKNLRVDNVNGELIVKMAKSLTDLTNATFGENNDNTVIDKNGVTITNTAPNGEVKTVSLTDNGLNNGGNTITNVARGTNNTDAVNLEQLTEVKNTAASGWNLSINSGENKSNIAPNATVDLASSGNGIVISKTGGNVTFGLDNNITVGTRGEDGKDGQIGVNGKDGSAVVINGKDGSIGLNGKDGANGLSIRGEQGPAGVNGKDGENKTRIVYEYKDPNTNQNVTEHVATLNDGLKFTGDNTTSVIGKKLNETLTIKGNLAEDAGVADGNIRVDADNGALVIKLANNLTGLTTATFGSENDKTQINKDGITIVNANGNNVSLTDSGLNNGNNIITNVSSGLVDGSGNKADLNNATATNAVNVGDLKDTVSNLTNATTGGFGLTDENGESVKADLGKTVTVKGDGSVTTNVVTAEDGSKSLQVGLSDNVTVGAKGENGKDGVIGVNGKDGSAVVINGKDGSIGLNGKDGANGLSIKGAQGPAGVNGKDGENKTRIVYEYKDPATGENMTEQVATLNDGLKFKGDNGVTVERKLNSVLDVVGGANVTALSENNIGVVADANGSLAIKLAKDLANLTSAAFGDAGDNLVVNKDSVTIVNGDKKVNLSENGLDNGGNKITHVADGEVSADSKDAVNGSQLYATNQLVGQGFNIAADNGATDNVKLGETVSYTSKDGNIITTVSDNAIDFALGSNVTVGGKGADGKDGVDGRIAVDGKDGQNGVTINGNGTVSVGAKGENGKDGVDGVIGINGKDGSAVVINGKDGSIGATGADGKTGVAINGANGTVGINGKDGSQGTITVSQGQPGVDGKDGETKTRIVYETTDKDGNPITEQVATLKDGLKFAANTGDVHNATLNSQVNVLGGSSNADWSKFDNGENVMTYINGNIITIGIAKNLVNLTSATFGTAGDNTVVNKDGITISNGNGNNVSLTENGLNNGNNQITNVASGLGNTALADAGGSTLTNAANIGDVKTAVEDLTKGGFGLTDENGKEVKADLGKTVTVKGDGSVTTQVVSENGQSALQIGLSSNVTVGNGNEAGTITVKGENGKDGVVINGSDGSLSLKDANGSESIALNGKDGTAAFKDAQGNTTVAIDGHNGTVGISGENGVNTTVSGNGVTVGGGANGTVSLTDKGLNNGNNQITNVASGLVDADGNATDLANATKTNAVNVGDLVNAQKGAVDAATWKVNTQGQSDAGKAAQVVSNQTVTVNHGINTKVSEVKQAADGSYSYEIDVTGLPMEYVDSNGNTLVNVGGKFYTQTEGENGQLTLTPATPAKVRITSDTPMQLTNVADGKVAAGSTDAVNGNQLHSANQNIAQHLGGGSTVDANGNVTAPVYTTTDGNPSNGKTIAHNNVGDAINSLNTAVTKPLNFEADKGSVSAKLGATVGIKGDGKNITTTADENGVKVSLKDNIEVTSVKTGNTTLSNNGVTIVNGPSLTTDGIDAGGKTVNNVADGEVSATSTQAVNGSQLYATNQAIINNARNVDALNGRVDKLDRDISGVGASAAALASLPQATMPGKNLVAVAGGTHRGQSAVALGVSRISDNGRIILKLNAGHNSRGDSSVGMGVGYQW